MTMLTATAIISARETASGVFAHVAQSAQRAAGVYRSAVGSFTAASHKLHGVGLLGATLPAGVGLHALGEKNLEWDEHVHRFRAITEMSEKEFAALNARMVELSNKYGVHREEVLEGAQGWKEAGGKLEDFTRSMETYAKIARITKVPMKEAALETRGLMLAFGENTADPNAVKRMEEFFLVASKNIKGGAPALIEAMKNAAPIAAKLHWHKEQLAALISVGVAEGFQPGEVGRAWKTVPMRFFAPSKDAVAALRAANVDMEKLYGIDRTKLRDGAPLERALSANGLRVGEKVHAVIQKGLVDADFSHGMGPVQDKLTLALAKALGIKKGDAQNRRILAKAVDQHFKRAAAGIDLDELLKLKGMGLDFWSVVAGKEHASKIIATLNNPKLYQAVLDQIAAESDGAIDRKSAIFFDGFAHQFRRLQTTWENLVGSIGTSGVNADLANVFRSLADTFVAMQSANPDVVRTLFWGLTGLAAAPAAGFALMGLKEVLGLMASPQIAALVAAVGILAALGAGDLFKGGGGKMTDVYGPMGEFFGPGAKQREAPIMGTFRELSALFSEIVGILDSSGQVINSFFGMDPGDSLMLKGLQLINATIKNIWRSAVVAREAIDAWREGRDMKSLAELGVVEGVPKPDPKVDGKKEGDSRLWNNLDPDAQNGVGRFAQPKLPKTIREIEPSAGPQTIDVTGKVQADVTGELRGRMDFNAVIKVEGGGVVTSQNVNGGEVKAQLNTGRSMPDTGVAR